MNFSSFPKPSSPRSHRQSANSSVSPVGHHQRVDVLLLARAGPRLLQVGVRVAAAPHRAGEPADPVRPALGDRAELRGAVRLVRHQLVSLSLLLLRRALEDGARETRRRARRRVLRRVRRCVPGSEEARSEGEGDAAPGTEEGVYEGGLRKRKNEGNRLCVDRYLRYISEDWVIYSFDGTRLDDEFRVTTWIHSKALQVRTNFNKSHIRADDHRNLFVRPNRRKSGTNSNHDRFM